MMKKTVIFLLSLIFFIGMVNAEHHNQVIKPEVMTKVDVAGAIYDRPNMIKSTNNGNTTLDVTSLLSSDGKFETGMYRSEATHIDVIEPWGHDEFFYIIEGSIVLTSTDGSVLTVSAGEAASIPKEWTGQWDTDGYSKIWVIYYSDKKE